MENQRTPEGKTPILQRVIEFNNILSQAQESIPSDVKVKWNELYSELSHHQEANAEQERLYKSELWHLGERSTNEIKRLEEANAKLVEALRRSRQSFEIIKSMVSSAPIKNTINIRVSEIDELLQTYETK